MKCGDNVNINEYVVKISSINDNVLMGKIVGKVEKKGEPKINITIFMGYIKADKMDYVIQKSVELGVRKIVPVLTKNSVVKLDDKDKLKKKERLQKIVTEAIGQCGRTDDVIMGDILDLKNIEKILLPYDLVLVCHEQEKNSLHDLLKEYKNETIKNIAVIIGPEGGLDKDEIKRLLEYGNAKCVCFGERILRAETAANYILSILDYEFNN